MSTDAISAIKARYATLSSEQQKIMLKELGISDISSINIIDPKVAERYCKNNNIQTSLANNSAWVKYNNAKENWNTYHDAYTNANSVWQDLKSKKDTASVNYNNAVTKAVAENNGQKLSASQDQTIRRNTNYTTETINNATDAEFTADMWLEKCKMAVDDQRAGLNFGTMADGLNFYG